MLDLEMHYLGACALAPDASLSCWGNGVGNRATPLEASGSAVDNVAMYTSCTPAELPTAIRHLTRDDDYRVSNLSDDIVCD